MPLTARLRDEENERINNMLNQLIGLDYVPETATTAINDILSGIDWHLQQLLDCSTDELRNQVSYREFDWANTEHLADFLLRLASRLTDHQNTLTEKAVFLYSWIQRESKTFSWEIAMKINKANQQQS